MQQKIKALAVITNTDISHVRNMDHDNMIFSAGDVGYLVCDESEEKSGAFKNIETYEGDWVDGFYVYRIKNVI